MFVCVRESDCESVCVCQRESVCVCVCVCVRERVYVCVICESMCVLFICGFVFRAAFIRSSMRWRQ